MAFKARHKGKVFYAYILSYAAILLIPIVMSLIVFNRANTIVTTETTRANDLLLQQMTSQLDRAMTSVFQLHSLIAYNSRLDTMFYESLPVDGSGYYRAYLLARDFTAYHIANGGSIDFYVYLPAVDLIVSPDGYFTTRSYHAARRQQLGVGYDDWIASFVDVSRLVYREDEIQTETEGVKPTIAMVTPLPVGPAAGSALGWSVIHVDQDLVDGIFSDTAWTAENVLLVYDRRFGILASSGPVAQRDLAEHEAKMTAAVAPERVEIGARGYRVFARSSQVVDWQYVSLVPDDIYAERFGALRRFTIAAFLICLALGVATIFWFASSRYRPVHTLLEILEPESDGTVSLRSDEFATIINSLQDRLAEDRRLQEELDRSRPLLTQRYLQQLLRGVTVHNDDAALRLRTLGVVLEGNLQLILLEIDEPPEAERRSMDVVSAIEESQASEIGPVSQSWIVHDLEGAVGILTCRSEPDDSNLFDYAVTLREHLEASTGRPCAVGLSATHPAGGVLSSLYWEARSALRYRLVRGRSRPIRFAEVQTTGRTYYYPLEIEGRLINSIRAGDYEVAAGIVNDVYAHNFQGNSLTIDMARCLMFDLTSTMIKTLNSIDSISDDATFWARVRPITNLTDCRSLEQLTHAMDLILTQTCGHVKSNRTTHSQRLRDEILAFVQEHLTDRNLCPEMVAEHFDRNAAYLSRFFRDELSIGMSGYIKQERVAASRRLLVETTMSVREVADQVGFTDSNALIRAFKESEGLTPGEFRASFAGSSVPT